MPMLTRRRLLGAGALLAVATAGSTAEVARGATTAPAATPHPSPFRFALPEPTGPYLIGTTELHLVDHTRRDPWVPERPRELMVSLWYPTSPGQAKRAPRAPYLRPLVAAYYDETVAPAIGVTPGQIDFAGVRTHARVGVAVAPGARPLVVYSPGFGVPRAFGTVLVEDLASHGYVVVTIDHTYETSVVEFPGGRVAPQTLPDSSPDRLRKAMKVREHDTRFVLNQLVTSLGMPGLGDASPRPPHGLDRAVRRSPVGMVGHSAGGVGAADVMHVDRRVRAGIDMDGFLNDSDDDTPPSPVAAHGLDRPFLVMGSVLPDGRPRTHHTNTLWRWLWRRSTGPMLDLNVPTGRHYTFTDYQAIMPQLVTAVGLSPAVRDDFVGTVDLVRIVRSVRAYVRAFFDKYLRGRAQPLLDRPSPDHPDVVFVP